MKTEEKTDLSEKKICLKDMKVNLSENKQMLTAEEKAKELYPHRKLFVDTDGVGLSDSLFNQCADFRREGYIKGHEEGKAEANAEWTKMIHSVTQSWFEEGKIFGRREANAEWQEKVRWINVEERLPERNVNVEIKRSKPFNQYILTAFQRDGVFYSNETGEPFYNATHWREIIE